MLSTIESVNNVVNNFIWGCAGNDLHHWSWSAAELQNEIFTDPQIPVCDEGDDRTNAQEEGCIGRSVDPVSGSMYGTGSYGRNGKYSRCGRCDRYRRSGAVFWMWISAILGMCTKFSEVTLAVHFREKNADGDLVGGPMYYIKNGLKKNWHWLAYLFAAFGVLTVLRNRKCNSGSIRSRQRSIQH